MATRLEARTRVREAVQEVIFTPPTNTIALNPTAGGSLGAGVYKFAVAFVYEDGRSEIGPRTSVTTTSTNNAVAISSIDVGAANSGVISRQVWRTKVGGSTYFLDKTITDNDNTTTTSTNSDSSLDTQYKSLHGYITDTSINYWLNYYNRAVAARTRCLSYNQTGISVDAGTSTLDASYVPLTLETNFRASWDNGTFDRGRLKPISVADLDRVFPNWDLGTRSGVPSFIFRRKKSGTQLELWPAPSSTGTINILYSTIYNDLTADTEYLLADTPTNSGATTFSPFTNAVIYNTIGEIIRQQGSRMDRSREYFALAGRDEQLLAQHVGEVLDESQVPFSPNPYPTTNPIPITEDESVPAAQVEALKVASQGRGQRRRS